MMTEVIKKMGKEMLLQLSMVVKLVARALEVSRLRGEKVEMPRIGLDLWRQEMIKVVREALTI